MKRLDFLINEYSGMITAVYSHNGELAEAHQNTILLTLDAHTDFFASVPPTDAERVLGRHLTDWIEAHVARSSVPDDYTDNVRDGYLPMIAHYQKMYCDTCLNLLDVETERIERLIILYLTYAVTDNRWTSIIPSVYKAGIQLLDLFLNVVTSAKIESELERNGAGAIENVK